MTIERAHELYLAGSDELREMVDTFIEAAIQRWQFEVDALKAHSKVDNRELW